MSTPRILSAGVVIGLAAGLLLGVGLMQPGRVAATAPSAAPTVPSSGPIGVAPGALPAITSGQGGVGMSGTAVTGAASAGSAIAYPYFGGMPGIAPDHTIVVSGQGQGNLKSDGSGQAAAERSALAAALADARAQADTIAAETRFTITGVLSVSASVFPSYGVEPMTGSTSGGATSGGGPGQPIPPEVAPAPATPLTLSVSVTVAYQVN